MKTFVINLDKDPERMSSMGEQLHRLEIDYERVAGVYAKAMTAEERNKYVNRFRWWCAVGRPVMPAEIGCALSHKQIYERMIREDIPFACIFEDDVLLAEELPAQLKMIEEWITVGKPEVVMLSNHTGMDFNKVGQKVFAGAAGQIFRTKTGMCTDGYCITKDAARKLLQQNFPIIVPCDNWWRWVANGVIELYHAAPSTVAQDQDQFGSSTSAGREQRLRPLTIRWAIHKSKRLIGKPLDWMMGKILGK